MIHQNLATLTSRGGGPGGSHEKDEAMSNATKRPQNLRLAAVLNGGLALIAVGLATSIPAVLGNASGVWLTAGLLAWIIAGAGGAFHLHITRDELHIWPVVMVASVVGTAIASVASRVVGSTMSIQVGLWAGVTVALALAGGLLAGRRVLRSLWRAGEFRSSALVVGSGPITMELAAELSHRPELGIDLVDVIRLGRSDHAVLRSEVDLVRRAIDTYRPDRLIVGDLDDDVSVMPALRIAGMTGTRVYVLPRLFSMGIGNALFAPDRLRGYPLLRVNRSVHPELALAAKRSIDIAVSLTGLLVLSPLLLLVAILTKLTSPGPLLFWQERVGRNGQLIQIPKFRSMRSSETSDFEWTAEQRITRFGRVLRRSAIDEIPQLWSILRGDMSLVGPRPERPAFAEEFSLEHADYSERLRMRVGLTGLAQIAGLRGDTSIAERAKYDNLYIDQWSLLGDFVILFRTFGAVVSERRRADAHREFEQVLSSLVLSQNGHSEPAVVGSLINLEAPEAPVHESDKSHV